MMTIKEMQEEIIKLRERCAVLEVAVQSKPAPYVGFPPPLPHLFGPGRLAPHPIGQRSGPYFQAAPRSTADYYHN